MIWSKANICSKVFENIVSFCEADLIAQNKRINYFHNFIISMIDI